MLSADDEQRDQTRARAWSRDGSAQEPPTDRAGDYDRALAAAVSNEDMHAHVAAIVAWVSRWPDAFSSVQFISVVIVGSSVLAIINKAMTGTD